MELSAPKRRNSNLRTNHEFFWGFWKCRVHFHSIWMLHRIAPWLAASSNIFQARGQTCDPSGFCCHKMPTPQRKKRKKSRASCSKEVKLALKPPKNLRQCGKMFKEQSSKSLQVTQWTKRCMIFQIRRFKKRFARQPIASGTRPCISWETCSQQESEACEACWKKCPFCRLSRQLCPLATLACCQRFAWAHLHWKGLFTNYCQALVITAISDKSNKNSNSR